MPISCTQEKRASGTKSHFVFQRVRKVLPDDNEVLVEALVTPEHRQGVLNVNTAEVVVLQGLKVDLGIAIRTILRKRKAVVHVPGPRQFLR